MKRCKLEASRTSRVELYDTMTWTTEVIHMGVSKNRGTPKWMVYNGNTIKMDDLGVPPFKETPIWIM